MRRDVTAPGSLRRGPPSRGRADCSGPAPRSRPDHRLESLSKRNFFTLRNEWWRDEQGERSGFATNYSSHTLGWTHQLSDVLELRPEVGYYHSYDAKAFDLGRRNFMWMGGLDLVLRF